MGKKVKSEFRSVVPYRQRLSGLFGKHNKSGILDSAPPMRGSVST